MNIYFHAGTKKEKNITPSGGRVLNFVSTSQTI